MWIEVVVWICWFDGWDVGVFKELWWEGFVRDVNCDVGWVDDVG